MNSTGNTVDNITSSMDNVYLTDATYTVYLVKRENQSSHPEGDLAIFVKTEIDAGDIQAFKAADDHIQYYRVAIRVDEIGESLMSIGTTLARDYPGSWDEALKQLSLEAKESNQQLALSPSALKVSRWSQLARAALKNAGTLKEFEAAPITFRVES
ncbi:uncharacterized protein N7500_010531 [Penicillium coprophilum]|uniref:uncharacterized protein n=1 Tax=Penicillium coprophilum TaxID=36646 RepID=UPI0023A6DE5D|nr:uncharacterized protein N7500_010531 [Penicillium coprophilum]KAJ5155092.1 hypothetical protein N7500_010531 [Penicillium coprophilum]